MLNGNGGAGASHSNGHMRVQSTSFTGASGSGFGGLRNRLLKIIIFAVIVLAALYLFLSSAPSFAPFGKKP